MLHQIQDYESLGIVVGSLKNQEVDLEPVFVMYGFHAKRGLDIEWWVELSQKVVESELGECPGSVVVGELAVHWYWLKCIVSLTQKMSKKH